MTEASTLDPQLVNFSYFSYLIQLVAVFYFIFCWTTPLTLYQHPLSGVSWEVTIYIWPASPAENSGNVRHLSNVYGQL